MFHYYTPLDPDDEPDSANRVRILKAYRNRGPLPGRATVGLPTLNSATKESATVHNNICSQADIRSRQGSIVTSSFPNENYTDARQSTIAPEHLPVPTQEIFQSITCSLGNRDKSFEELRLECYLQSRIATGLPPKPVSHTISWWSVIPPTFVPFIQETTPHHIFDSASETGESMFSVDAIMSAEYLTTGGLALSITSEPVIPQPNEDL